MSSLYLYHIMTAMKNSRNCAVQERRKKEPDFSGSLEKRFLPRRASGINPGQNRRYRGSTGSGKGSGPLPRTGIGTSLRVKNAFEKIPCPLILRMGEDDVRRPRFLDNAVRHIHDMRADVTGKRHFMRHDEHGHIVFRQ